MGSTKENDVNHKENLAIGGFDATDVYNDQLLADIEQGQIPLDLLASRLLELVIRLERKESQLDNLLKSFTHISDISRKITDLHTLHFPTKELKKKTQRDRFMAQILLGPTRKL